MLFVVTPDHPDDYLVIARVRRAAPCLARDTEHAMLAAIGVRVTMPEHAKPSDVVVSLDPWPGERVERGQVGIVIERLDQGRVLVEFSDTKGKTQAVLPIKRSRPFVLHETVTMEPEC